MQLPLAEFDGCAWPVGKTIYFPQPQPSPTTGWTPQLPDKWWLSKAWTEVVNVRPLTYRGRKNSRRNHGHSMVIEVRCPRADSCPRCHIPRNNHTHFTRINDITDKKRLRVMRDLSKIEEFLTPPAIDVDAYLNGA